jgi:Chitin synthase
MALADS